MPEPSRVRTSPSAASGFVHYNLQIIGYDGTTGQTIPVATQREWGLELEAAYHTENTRLAISHSYVDLYDFNLAMPTTWTNISSMGYGYGDDLGRWSNHITKVTAQHKLDDQWTLEARCVYIGDSQV